jgi:UDP-3-O-[3-hydroxymyristoyl] N-acetylglucosamine deacetylase
MAALRGCGIDNAVVEIEGPEVPILDGSAAPFVTLIQQAGALTQDVPRKTIRLHRQVKVTEGDKVAILIPQDRPRITVTIDFPSYPIGCQTRSVRLTEETFVMELAAARTFGFKQGVGELRAQGFAHGACLRNTVVIDGDAVVNPEGLRYRDEFVRHKLLDCVGDLALAGVPVLGHFVGFKTGHGMHNALLRRLFEQPEAWSLVDAQQPSRLSSRPLSAGPALEHVARLWRALTHRVA